MTTSGKWMPCSNEATLHQHLRHHGSAMALLLMAATGSLYGLLLERGIDAFRLPKIHSGCPRFTTAALAR